MKKIVSFLLVLVLVISAVPMGALSVGAAVGTTGNTGECFWSLSDDGVLTISGNGAMGAYMDIGYAPWGAAIESAVIEKGVTNIGRLAFSNCKNLVNVTIADTVTSIDEGAFYGCTSLASITIPDSVTSIGSSAFYNCNSLTDVYYGGSWGDYTNIDIAYYNNDQIKNATWHYAKDEVLKYSYDDATLTATVLECMPTATNVVIPKTVEKDGITYTVTSIHYGAFYECTSVTSITIPNSITSIGSSAFSGCTSLTDIIIPDSVTSIDFSAFSGCTSLTSITIPDSVTNIVYNAFSGCTSLTDIIIPDSVTSIGSSAFYGCTSLASITIPDSVTSIGDSAFYNCNSLTDVYYSGSWVDYTNIYIENGNVQLINATWHYAKNDIFKYSYDDATLTATVLECMPTATNVVIPKTVEKDGTTYTVTNIGWYAFSGCTSLTSITIPDSVTSIGDSAFYGCSSLASITIPDSVNSIANSAFYNCTRLTSVKNAITGECRWDFENGTLTISGKGMMGDNDPYYDFAAERHMYAPWDTLKTKINNVIIKDDVTYIGMNAFNGCTGFTNITIPDSVTGIGESAFKDCDNLTSVVIPKGVSVFCEQVFANCDNLTEITVPNTIAIVDTSAFANCPKLTNVWYMGTEDRRSYIGIYGGNNNLLYANWHFNSCIGSADHKYNNGCDIECNVCDFVREPVHNYNVQNICSDCGYNIILDYIEYKIVNGNAVIIYCDYSIAGDFVIPSEIDGCAVTGIERNAFFMCRRLKNITIPKTVTEIGDWAFDYCYGLTNVYYQGNESQKQEIIMGEGNLDLSNATWHYNCCLSDEDHVYDDDSDNTCNNCGFVRNSLVTETGDLNGDGKVNGRDYGMLMQYLNSWDVTISTDAADVNGDGKVNGRDYGMLMQYLNGWDVEFK